MAKLTDKQEKFVQELLKGKSQREAYKAAYDVKKMSDSSIDVKASELFRNGKLRLRYDELKDKLVKKAEDECIVTATDVLKELAKIGFANITDYLEVKEMEVVTGYDKNDKPIINNMKMVDVYQTASIHKDKLGAVAEIKQTRDGIAIKMHDKVKALEDIAKHLGMFVEKVEHSGEITYTVQPNN
ncbi:terminase small subunit, partial [Arthrospira platensis SPKY1]|nr:terminase small subunit [Arthrospira platensis SPKY1]